MQVQNLGIRRRNVIVVVVRGTSRGFVPLYMFLGVQGLEEVYPLVQHARRKQERLPSSAGGVAS